MKYIFALFFYIVLLSSLNASDFAIALSDEEQRYLQEKKEITMCVDPDWEPFEVIDKNGKHVGIAADLIELVAQRVGVKIKLVQTKTWEETLFLSQTQKCDILSFVNQTPKREEWLIFTQPILSDPNILVTREEHPFVADLHGLDHESVVLPFGTAILERFSRDFPNLEMIGVVSEADAMQMVSEKKADMTVRSLIVAAYIIKKEGWFNLKISGQPQGYENHLRIGVLKNNKILRSILDKAIQTISPIEREAIINKHTGLTLKNGIDTKVVFYVTLGLFLIIGFIALWNYFLRTKVRLEVAKNLQIKEELYTKAKQAEIGNLIANISHQWREPLSKLSSINLLTMVKLKTGQEIQKEWLLRQSEDIENTIDFMSQTMQNFLEFYKKSTLSHKFLAIESVEGVLSIIETKIIDHDIKIDFQGDATLMIEGIKNEWMQVWLNLLNNAIQILVQRNIHNPTITINISAHSISFCDNGGGMKEKIASNGLGLPMCSAIATKYGATFELKNGNFGVCAQILFV